MDPRLRHSGMTTGRHSRTLLSGIQLEKNMDPRLRHFGMTTSRHSRTLLSGIQLEKNMDPRLRHSGMTTGRHSRTLLSGIHWVCHHSNSSGCFFSLFSIQPRGPPPEERDLDFFHWETALGPRGWERRTLPLRKDPMRSIGILLVSVLRDLTNCRSPI